MYAKNRNSERLFKTMNTPVVMWIRLHYFQEMPKMATNWELSDFFFFVDSYALLALYGNPK